MYKRPKEFPVACHNDFNYDYLFIMEKLSEEFKGQSDFYAKNTEKYINFSVPM